MVGKAAYVIRALDYGVVVVEGADVGGIGCCCSSTSNEGGHVCIGNKSRDTAVACTRRQQQQQEQQQREVRNSGSSSRGRSAAAAAAAGGRGWGRRGWIVRWILLWVQQHAGRGDSVCTRNGRSSIHYYLVKFVSFYDEGRNFVN